MSPKAGRPVDLWTNPMGRGADPVDSPWTAMLPTACPQGAPFVHKSTGSTTEV